MKCVLTYARRNNYSKFTFEYVSLSTPRLYRLSTVKIEFCKHNTKRIVSLKQPEEHFSDEHDELTILFIQIVGASDYKIWNIGVYRRVICIADTPVSNVQLRHQIPQQKLRDTVA